MEENKSATNASQQDPSKKDVNSRSTSDRHATTPSASGVSQPKLGLASAASGDVSVKKDSIEGEEEHEVKKSEMDEPHNNSSLLVDTIHQGGGSKDQQELEEALASQSQSMPKGDSQQQINAAPEQQLELSER